MYSTRYFLSRQIPCDLCCHVHLSGRRDIEPGEEIFVKYGTEYWRKRPDLLENVSSMDPHFTVPKKWLDPYRRNAKAASRSVTPEPALAVHSPRSSSARLRAKAVPKQHASRFAKKEQAEAQSSPHSTTPELLTMSKAPQPARAKRPGPPLPSVPTIKRASRTPDMPGLHAEVSPTSHAGEAVLLSTGYYFCLPRASRRRLLLEPLCLSDSAECIQDVKGSIDAEWIAATQGMGVILEPPRRASASSSAKSFDALAASPNWTYKWTRERKQIFRHLLAQHGEVLLGPETAKGSAWKGLCNRLSCPVSEARKHLKLLQSCGQIQLLPPERRPIHTPCSTSGSASPVCQRASLPNSEPINTALPPQPDKPPKGGKWGAMTRSGRRVWIEDSSSESDDNASDCKAKQKPPKAAIEGVDGGFESDSTIASPAKPPATIPWSSSPAADLPMARVSPVAVVNDAPLTPPLISGQVPKGPESAQTKSTPASTYSPSQMLAFTPEESPQAPAVISVCDCSAATTTSMPALAGAKLGGANASGNRPAASVVAQCPP